MESGYKKEPQLHHQPRPQRRVKATKHSTLICILHYFAVKCNRMAYGCMTVLFGLIAVWFGCAIIETPEYWTALAALMLFSGKMAGMCYRGWVRDDR
ncbi:MAG TPA: hypothetical protein H9795_01435 [Candidatus Fournierella merdigallinarum]|nr:hypothetical protein [Candidatus Fournierella merdigallinarum]